MPIHHTHSIAGIPHQANASLPPLVFIHTFLSVTIIGLLKDLHKYWGLLHNYNCLVECNRIEENNKVLMNFMKYTNLKLHL
jgi:hypothetical protein